MRRDGDFCDVFSQLSDKVHGVFRIARRRHFASSQNNPLLPVNSHGIPADTETGHLGAPRPHTDEAGFIQATRIQITTHATREQHPQVA